jgi:hypothetical protein
MRLKKEIIMPKILKEFDCPMVKITVEENANFQITVTEWVKGDVLEKNRKIIPCIDLTEGYFIAFDLLSEWTKGILDANKG